jgi:hypothetical protein
MSEDKDKLFYTKGENFFQKVASGAAVSGPTPDGLLHITFTLNRVDVVSQTKTAITENGEETGFALSFDQDDTATVIESVGVVSLTEAAYGGLLGAIAERLASTIGIERTNEMLEGRGLALKRNGDDPQGER